MGRKKLFFSVFLLTGLFFIFPLGSPAQDQDTPPPPPFQDVMAASDTLKAEQDALGAQWQANHDRMAEMESRYNFLQIEIERKQAELETREEELTRLREAFEAAGPGLDVRVADFNARKTALKEEVAAFNSACGRTFSEAEEAAYNACQARRSLLQSQETTLNREISQYNADLEAFTKPLKAAKKAYTALHTQLLALTNESQTLIREGTALQQENTRLVEKGRRLSAEIEKTGQFTANARAGGDFLAALNAPRTRADYILEALEFGNGDWDLSLRYLNNLTRARPEDRAAAEAKLYLEGLAAEVLAADKGD